MSLAQKLIAAGALLGGGAAVFLAMAPGPALEEYIPGLLTFAFSGIAAWGGILNAEDPRRSLRTILGAAVGGLVSGGLLFIPAAVFLAAAAIVTWRKHK